MQTSKGVSKGKISAIVLLFILTLVVKPYRLKTIIVQRASLAIVNT